LNPRRNSLANLKVKIVLRLPASAGRGWIAANGKTDPQGTYNLRFYSGSKMKHERVKGNFHDAELAALRLERKLNAYSQSFVVPEEKAIDKPHRISEVIETYCKHLAVTEEVVA
jgi:hypothetical protein